MIKNTGCLKQERQNVQTVIIHTAGHPEMGKGIVFDEKREVLTCEG